MRLFPFSDDIFQKMILKATAIIQTFRKSLNKTLETYELLLLQQKKTLRLLALSN